MHTKENVMKWFITFEVSFCRICRSTSRQGFERRRRRSKWRLTRVLGIPYPILLHPPVERKTKEQSSSLSNLSLNGPKERGVVQWGMRAISYPKKFPSCLPASLYIVKTNLWIRARALDPNKFRVVGNVAAIWVRIRRLVETDNGHSWKYSLYVYEEKGVKMVIIIIYQGSWSWGEHQT